ncbi:MAG: C40 family peptidase [Bacteroidota bacterium]
MEFGICPLSVVPIRSSASDKSEMVSQLLFGEMVEFLEKKGSWTKIRCLWDNYIGWVDVKQVKAINHRDFERYSGQYAYSLELVQAAMAEGHCLPLTIGATLPNYDGIKFHLNGSSFTFSGQAISPLEVKPSAELILKIARRYLYAPYLWGGRSPMGIDCSGFTQIVFKMVGMGLPRDAAQQVERGKLIDFIEMAQPADLAFFENKKGRITHVGLLMPENRIIHASGQVRIDRIDHFGIFNEDKQKYTHRLRVVKRILADLPPAAQTKDETEEPAKNQVEMF